MGVAGSGPCVDNTMPPLAPSMMARSSRAEDAANALSAIASQVDGLACRIQSAIDALESRLDSANEHLARIEDRVCVLAAAAEGQRMACERQMAAVVDQLGAVSASQARASKQQRALLTTLVAAGSEEEARAPSSRTERPSTPPGGVLDAAKCTTSVATQEAPVSIPVRLDATGLALPPRRRRDGR